MKRGEKKVEKELVFDFLIKIGLCLFWMKIFSVQWWLRSCKSQKKINNHQGKEIQKQKPPEVLQFYGAGRMSVSCDALGCVTVLFLLLFCFSRVWSSRDVSSASDSAEHGTNSGSVRHGTNSQISLGLTCKTALTFFVYLNYCFFLGVSTRPGVTEP